MHLDRRNKIEAQVAANNKRCEDLNSTHIRRIAVQSGLYDCITDPYDALKNGDQYSSVMPDLVKFAELIVGQCLSIIDERKHDLVNRTELWEEIKQHFEIK